MSAFCQGLLFHLKHILLKLVLTELKKLKICSVFLRICTFFIVAILEFNHAAVLELEMSIN